MKTWKLRVYEGHIGILDPKGNPAASIHGWPYSQTTVDLGNFMVKALNATRKIKKGKKR